MINFKWTILVIYFPQQFRVIIFHVYELIECIYLILEYFVYPRESEAEECTTPGLMPAVANNESNEQPAELPSKADFFLFFFYNRHNFKLDDTDFSDAPRERQERTNIDTTVEDGKSFSFFFEKNI